MSRLLITAGSQVTRVYWSVPENYGYGPEFDSWNAALRHAQDRRADLVVSLAKSLDGFATAEKVAETADIQVRIQLRWLFTLPDGTTVDLVIESYRNVNKLTATA